MTTLPARSPRRTPETAEFWEAVSADRFVLPRCNACSTYIWYPRLFCPACGSLDVSYVEASGQGAVYSYTVVRKGDGPFREMTPYVLGIVELAEGPRLMTNIVTDDVESISCGQAVHVVFEPAGESDRIYRFAP